MPYQPNNPNLYAFGSTPMFGAPDSTPRFTGPVNINVQGNNAAGALLQLGLPMALQGTMQRHGMAMGQLFPTQNMFDQMVAQQYFMGQQRAMQMGSRRDAAFIEDFLGGGTAMFNGRRMTPQEQQRNFAMAQQGAAMLPMAINLFGPDRVDQFLGGRSASVLAHHMFAAGRTSVDPATGQIGMTADSSSLLSDEIFERLYGRGSSPGALRNLKTRHMGGMLEQMQMRGLLGTGPRGFVTPSLDEGTVQRLAERLPEMQGLAADSAGYGDKLEQARQKIRGTHTQMRDAYAAGTPLSPQDIGRLAGGDDVLRVGDAKRITQKLKNMSGAVAAMREIFGDMGHPNAPMQEIMNGLDALTQGGLGHMSPAQIERTVRTTHAIAKQTGIGMQAMLGLTAQAANTADLLGLDRSLAVQATQGAALFGAAMGNSGGLDIPAWGALTKEQLTLLDQQSRLTAAASPAVNQINAALRMADEGVMKAKAGSELEAMLAAARSGEASYTYKGTTKSLNQGRAALMDMMEREGGVSKDLSQTYMLDPYGNQEYGAKYGTADLGRQLQREEAVELAAATFAGRANIASGGKLGKDLSKEIGAAMSETLFGMDAETLRDTKARNAALAKATRDVLRSHGKSGLEQSFGGADALAGSAYAALNSTIRTDPRTAATQGGIGFVNLYSNNPEIRRQRQEADATASMTAAFAGIGFGTPLEKFTQAIAEAGPGTSFMDILAKSTIGVPWEQMAKDDIVMAGVLAAGERSRKVDRDKSGAITEKGRKQMDEEAKLVTALSAGGEAAQAELDRRRKDGTLSEEMESQLVEAHRNGGAAARVKKYGGSVRSQLEASYQSGGMSADMAQMNLGDGPRTGFDEGAKMLGPEASAAQDATDAAAKGEKTQIQLTGTLTVIGPDQGKLSATGTGDVGTTPVVSGG